MISVIDDDDGVREATASLLRSLGYEVQTFDSARAFLDWSELNNNISCAIIDIMMPGIDGFELYRRLIGGGCRFPIIFLTALSDVVAKARMTECGAHGILTKPCSQQSLIDCIESALAYERQRPAGGPNS
jgi:FixJ family two-component response regulator